MNAEQATNTLQAIDTGLLALQVIADFRSRADAIEAVLAAAKAEGRDVTQAEIDAAKAGAAADRAELVSAIDAAGGS